MKWLWKLQLEPESTWTTSINLLYGTTDITELAADTRTSMAFKDILSYKDFFAASTAWVGDPQRLVWNWSPSGLYSSASAYGILADSGLRSPYHALLWKLKIPPKVKVFLWVVLLDKALTQQNLLTRNWPTILACVCCSHGSVETASHLWVLCDYATQVWTLIQTRFSLPVLTFVPSVHQFWLHNRSSVGQTWDIIWAATTWTIWKERNRRIFTSKSLPPQLLMAEICAAIVAWLTSA
ncbi:hypothetical protein LUZ61_019777 [Rhynchospora tenuis]|uniref:Reverse transcriptase zinc-binding domain-containing protein n=1 Tax=Rhynchospora tenuis TaxID=198213 RepID=A0AAD5ZBT9_9POAL|nr:hypothetical protein LUZ61_019777 [Rhynchospora tenuis]